MKSLNFKLLPPPPTLKHDVECIRVAEYSGDTAFAIQVCLNGRPGIVFQHHNGYSPVERIVTPEGNVSYIPPLYVYGQVTHPGIMYHKAGPYTMIQVVLKPHALNTLLGVDACEATNSLVELEQFGSGLLRDQLLDTADLQEQVELLGGFLLKKFDQARSRDHLVEQSLYVIQQNSVSVTIKHLLDSLNISERQFTRRFSQTVGVTPHFYIRVKRFNEALRLMRTNQFDRLTDIAHALNFHDQSHFIRDIKAFSGTTPKTLAQKASDIDLAQKVYAYT